MKTIIGAVCALALSAAAVTGAHAAYPERPITLVIGYTAGGPTDVVGRFLAQGLEKELGQTVVVENRPGANAVVALQYVRRAPADGYTLYLGSSGTLSIEPVYKKRVEFDVLKDLTPVGLVASYPYLLVVPGSSPYKTTQELIEGAKNSPQGLSYASAGNGAVNHLAGEWFSSATQTNMTHIPYKGDSAAIADLSGGRVDMAFLSVIAATPLMESGRMRALALAARAPSVVAPGLDTVENEAGIEGFAAEPWNGVLAPAGLPEDVTLKLNQAINNVMSTEEAKAKLLTLGQTPFSGTPKDFAKHIETQTENWRTLIDTAGIERID